MHRIALLPAILLVLSVACTSERTPSIERTNRDSAGVRILQSSSAGYFESGWRLSRRPIFRTGWENDEPNFERVVAGVVRPAGGVIVGDSRSGELWFISSEGDVEGQYGGRGEGPGEYQDITAIEWIGADSLLVFDSNGRVSVLDADGSFARSFHWEWRTGAVGHKPVGVASAGSIVWTAFSWAVRPGSNGRAWVRAPILSSDRHGTSVDTLAVRRFVEVIRDDGAPKADPFRGLGIAAVTRNRIVWTRRDRPEVQWLGMDGRLRQVFRWTEEAVDVDDEVWEEYVDARVSQVVSSPEVQSKERLRERLEKQRDYASSTLPLFRYFIVDDRGQVWLGQNVHPGMHPSWYRVLSPSGEWIGRVSVPENFRILAIGRDRVLGVHTDHWNVQAVAVHELIRD